MIHERQAVKDRKHDQQKDSPKGVFNQRSLERSLQWEVEEISGIAFQNEFMKVNNNCPPYLGWKKHL